MHNAPGRHTKYLDASGEIVERYGFDDDINWRQNTAMLKMIQKKKLPFNFGEVSH